MTEFASWHLGRRNRRGGVAAALFYVRQRYALP